MEVKWRMPFIIDDDWKQGRLDTIRSYVDAVRKGDWEQGEKLTNDVWFILSPTVFTEPGLRSLYVNELREFLTSILDLVEEWETDYQAQVRQRPWHLIDDQRHTFYLVKQILLRDENIPEDVLSRACHSSNRTYRNIAAQNPNCPEVDRVYVWLHENAEAAS